MKEWTIEEMKGLHEAHGGTYWSDPHEQIVTGANQDGLFIASFKAPHFGLRYRVNEFNPETGKIRINKRAAYGLSGFKTQREAEVARQRESLRREQIRANSAVFE